MFGHFLDSQAAQERSHLTLELSRRASDLATAKFTTRRLLIRGRLERLVRPSPRITT
jgi:hypothetical protein